MSRQAGLVRTQPDLQELSRSEEHHHASVLRKRAGGGSRRGSERSKSSSSGMHVGGSFSSFPSSSVDFRPELLAITREINKLETIRNEIDKIAHDKNEEQVIQVHAIAEASELKRKIRDLLTDRSKMSLTAWEQMAIYEGALKAAAMPVDENDVMAHLAEFRTNVANLDYTS